MAGELDDLRRELNQRVRVLARTTATRWESQLRQTNPVDTGLMRSQTRVRDEPTASGVRITAVVDTDYAEFVSSGTRPHVIRAHGRALRFNWHGRTVYFKSVNHPGTRPNPWWTNSVRNLPSLIRGIWSGL